MAACGVIAAITSTADSLLCAVGSNIAQDFDLSWIQLPLLQRSQYIVWLVGISSFLASYFMPQNIITILTSSYELSVSCLFVPLIFCYYKTDVKKEAAIGALVAGLLGFIGFRLYDSLSTGKEILTLIFSLIGYYIGGKIR
ncbi:MAG TPA: sodium:solute symporter family protein, partial [Candidatus Bathyarchaeia archaeon]|nr:sodium:solute symporter family protein [Candidatus Bathyarchaeia archaeon]